MGRDTDDDADAIDDELARLELERQRLDLERQRLDLERERMELESAQDSESGGDRDGWQPPPALPDDRRRRRTKSGGPNTAALAAFGGVLAFLSIGALLYAFGDRDKLTFLPKEGDLTGETSGGAPPKPVSQQPPEGGGDGQDVAAREAEERRAAAKARRKREREAREEREAAAKRAIDAVAGGGESDAPETDTNPEPPGVEEPVAASEDAKGALVERAREQLQTLAAEDDPRAALARLAGLRRSLGALPDDLAQVEGRCREALKQRRESQARAREASAAKAAQRHQAQVAPFVDSALGWLWRHQHPAGYWDGDGWGTQCRVLPACRGPGTNKAHSQYDVGLTSLALMAFATQDLSRRASPYRDSVRRGARWLVAQQAANGALGFGGGERVYNHALATQALCALLSHDDLELQKIVREPASRAVAFVLKAQNPGLGWKYGVRSGRNDTSVTGWMVQALLAARSAGLVIDDQAFVGSLRWFERASDGSGLAGYEVPGGGSAFMPKNEGRFAPLPVMTAVVVSSRGRLERPSSRPRNWTRALELVLESPPKWEPRSISFYYWYYGTLALEAGQPGQFKAWRDELHAALLPNQRLRGCADGSWDPEGEWCLAGGRVFATAIGALIVQSSDVQDVPQGAGKLKVGGAWKPAAGGAPAVAPKPKPKPKRAPALPGKGVIVASKLGAPTPKSFIVRGRLTNTDSVRRKGIRVHVKLRLGNGDLAAELDAEAPDSLAPGATGRFRAEFKGPGAKVIQTFDVELDYDGAGAAPVPGAAPVAAAPAAGDGANKREYERAKAEKAVRARFDALLKARQPGELRCSSCNGTRKTRCEPCNGSGSKRVSRGGSSWRKTCTGCNGSGSKDCVTGSCIEGHSSLSLKRAFYEFLSPATRSEFRRPDIYLEIIQRRIAFSVFGLELEIAVARDVKVQVFPNRVTVSCTILWSPGEEEEPWSVDWIRVKGKYYVATRYDTSREPILGD